MPGRGRQGSHAGSSHQSCASPNPKGVATFQPVSHISTKGAHAGSVSDHAINRRANFRVAEIEQRQIALSESLIKSGLSGLILRYIELALCSL